MPKFKERVTERGNWDADKMKQAIQSVKEKKFSLREAADRYEVPRSTLQDRIKALNSGQEVNLIPKLGRFENTFSGDYLQQLYHHVKDLDNRLMPLTKQEFLKLAFQFAEHLKIPHRFNKEKKIAGKDFYYSFLKKYPDIALRTPESTSIARAIGFNKPQVDRFYDHLEQLLQEKKFPASRIYNADETGVSTVHKNEKVISTKGKKQVGKLTSGERGKNITLMFCMSVTGHFIPPLFIFPRKRMDKNCRLMIGAPAESIAVPHETGWMNAEIFLTWLQHFKHHVQPSKENPVLLILDGHGSHKELAVIEYARKHNIHMLSTPPHTTHKLQPLDRVFFKPFKAAFAAESAMWMRRNPGSRITDYDIAAIVNVAFAKAARLDIAQSGFRCSGIYPFNRDVFNDLDFLPSAMTNIEQNPASSGNLTCTTTDTTSQPSTSRNQQSSSSQDSDVRSLLGRSLARAKSTYYTGALADAARSAELEPENLTAMQIRAQTEYEKCSFERALVLAYRGQRQRGLPPNFADCARCAEETIRECAGKSAGKVLSSVINIFPLIGLQEDLADDTKVPKRKSRMQAHSTQQIQEISRVEKQKAEHTSRLMASKYLEQMAHDKYFLSALCKDDRLRSANKQGSLELQELADKALADIDKRQAVLRERRPLYAARASESAARERLSRARKQRVGNAQRQHITDAHRLVNAAQEMHEKHDTMKCLEAAEFGMEQISRIQANMLPGKEKFLQELYNIVAQAFLDQKRVREEMSEADREKRAFILLGIPISREPSHDSILRTRPLAPPRDAKRRLRTLERSLTLSGRARERCYVLHELARLHADTKQAHRARFYAVKCQSEAKSANQHEWLLNASFLLARCHVLQNNRPEARAQLIEGAALARSFRYPDVAAFFDTCVDVSLEGEITTHDSILEKREKAMVSLMQDDDLRQAAVHLFRRMSVLPASRRFSIMPGTRVEDTAGPTSNRRTSIMPRVQTPVRVAHIKHHPLGFQDFDS